MKARLLPIAAIAAATLLTWQPTSAMGSARYYGVDRLLDEPYPLAGSPPATQPVPDVPILLRPPAVEPAAGPSTRPNAGEAGSSQIQPPGAGGAAPSSQGGAPPAGQKDVPKDEAGGLTKGQKLLFLNVGAAATVMTYGLINWDYFQTSPKATSEGWFGRTTKSGGADKLGHFWSTYTLTDLISYVYKEWGYTPSKAAGYGALSAIGVQTLVEFGDAYSDRFGFSYEDLVMNILGGGTAYFLRLNPSLKEKIDLRVEYTPKHFSDLIDDVFTDYEKQRYLIALKLDGFDRFRDSYLGYLEFHLGYFTRGYEDFRPGDGDPRRRSVYVGLGFNVGKLLGKFMNSSVFNYIQVPYTSIRYDRHID